jgi:hypothetical protein
MEEAMRQQLELQLACTRYFQEHSHASATLDELKLWLDCRTELLEVVLERLVSLEIVEQLEQGKGPVYRYKLPQFTIWDGLPWTNT